MRKMTLTGAVLIALTISLAGCSQPGASDEQMSDSSMSQSPMSESPMSESPDESSEMAAVSLSGDFEGLNDKTVAGTVSIEDDQLKLSGFSSDEGPDLHLYLTNGTDEAAVEAGVRIDAVAWDQESQTFTLDGVDAAQYTDVVIHCDKAKAVFGAAALS